MSPALFSYRHPTRASRPKPPWARPSAPPAPMSPVPRHPLTRHRLFPQNGRRPHAHCAPNRHGRGPRPLQPAVASASQSLDSAQAFSPKRPKAPKRIAPQTAMGAAIGPSSPDIASASQSLDPAQAFSPKRPKAPKRIAPPKASTKTAGGPTRIAPPKASTKTAEGPTRIAPPEAPRASRPQTALGPSSPDIASASQSLDPAPAFPPNGRRPTRASRPQTAGGPTRIAPPKASTKTAEVPHAHRAPNRHRRGHRPPCFQCHRPPRPQML